MRIFKRILFILVCIGLIWLIFILLSKAFSTSNTSGTSQQQKALSSYATTDAVVAMNIVGPIESNQEHKSLRISVSRSQAQVVLTSGFDGQVVRQETFVNNSESYINFLKALSKAQFDQPVKTDVSKDERGSCPLRNRFIYTLDEGGNNIFRAWTSTCGTGNFNGSQTLVRQLFLRQIPDSALRDVLRDSNFSTN